MMQKKTVIFLSAAIVGLLIASMLLRTGLTTEVEVHRVAHDTAIDAVPAIINVRSDYTFTLSSEERGRVEESQLSLGTSIREGDRVLAIDPTDLQIDADILTADIENLKARLALKSAEEAALRKRGRPPKLRATECGGQLSRP